MVKQALTSIATKTNIIANIVTVLVAIAIVFGNQVKVNSEVKFLDAKIDQLKIEQTDYHRFSLVRNDAFEAEVRERLNKLDVSLAESRGILEEIRKRIP